MTQKIKKRIFEEPVSSIAGIIVCIAAFVLLYLKTIDFTQFWMVLGLGLVLLGLKDKFLGIKGPTILLIFSILVSCSPTKKYQAWVDKGLKNKWYDTTTIEEKTNIPINTSSDDSLAEDATERIIEVINDTCVNKNSREIIKTIIKEKLIPGAVRSAYKDTSVTDANGTTVIVKFSDSGYQVDLKYKQSKIIPPPVKIIEYKVPWYLWLTIILMAIVIVGLIYLNYKILSAYTKNK